jgi:hypothetical protein
MHKAAFGRPFCIRNQAVTRSAAIKCSFVTAMFQSVAMIDLNAGNPLHI